MKKIKLKEKLPKKEKVVKKTSKPKEERTLWKTILSVILCGAIGIVGIFIIFALYIVITSPNFEKQKLYQKEPTILYDKFGNEFARVGESNSTVLTYEEIPDVMIDALIATEDSRFFQHNGVDLFRFIKASIGQFLGKKDSGGASTISMQVIKNTYNGGTKAETEGIKGIVRKFKDIYMSIFKLEANYTKEEIIEFYLNSQWLASDGALNYAGIIGVEQASLYYFGKSAKELSLPEASLIIGMFNNPDAYNPYRHPEKARDRQKTVLNLMVRHGYITEKEKEDALKIPITSLLIDHAKTNTSVGSEQAFIDYVLDEVSEELGINPSQVSLSIYTTFDQEVQKVLAQVEDGELYKFPNEAIEEGIAVTSVEDGSITALSGGRGYVAKGTNLATDMVKQPGSTAKPIFDYAMYIEHISQSTYAMFIDEATTYSNGQTIHNYDNSYKHLITMRYALEDSRNIPALLAFRAVYKLDKSLIENFVHSVGIDYGPELFESFSIGGLPNGISPLQSSAAYATFGRGGYYIKPYAYTKVINNETGKEHLHSYVKEKVLEESTAYMINNILTGAYGGRGPSGTTVAGKTGTNNLDGDTRKAYNLKAGSIMDVWIVSYSPSYSISLWYGYKQIETDAATTGHYLTSTSGGNARRTIMNALATKIHKKNQQFSVPKSVVKVNVEKETFPPALCSAYTPNTSAEDMCLEEYFVAGTEPTEVSKRYDTLDNPTNGSYSYEGNTITIKWDPISTPSAIDPSYLRTHFNTYYGDYADMYYNKRLDYNNSKIGSVGYEVYLKNGDTETYLGYTSGNTFSYVVPSGGAYTFIVKSAYSIFKQNMSSGLTISTATIDSNIGDIVGGNTDNETEGDNNTPDTGNTNTDTNNNN